MTNDSTVERFLGLILDSAIIVVLLVFSLNFALKAGERGLFPHDQSILFDGAYRIVQGQTPYRDFFMPFCPGAFWFQALFFKILGVDHFSCLVAATLLNVLATLLSILLIRQLFPERRYISYLAGLVTAVWFSPPFGTLWIDQTAFLFSLIGMVSLLRGLPREQNQPTLAPLLVVSGCAAFASLATKQNIGLFALPLYPGLISLSLLPDTRRIIRSMGYFASGFAGCLLIFVIWLFRFSHPASFWHYAVSIPGHLGFDRLLGDFFGLLVTLLFERGPVFDRFVTSAFLIFSVLLLVFYTRDRRSGGYSAPGTVLPPFLLAYIILFQRLIIHTTRNQPENGFPFMGILLAIGLGILLRFFASENPRIKRMVDGLRPFSRRDARAILVAAVLLSTLYVTVKGISVSLNRDVQDSVAGSSFPRYLTHTGLLSLRWGVPTKVLDADVKERDINNILTYLRERRKNFFVFPDFTIFYGLVQVPPPQPLLYFAAGETYPASGDSALDSLIVSRLKESQVEIVVLEEKSVSGGEKILENFPLLKSYLEETFVKIGKIGIFHIYRKPEYGFCPPAEKWTRTA